MLRMRVRLLVLLSSLLSVLLPACSAAENPTATAASIATPTASPTAVVLPTSTPDECSNEAQFLEDPTIPDGTALAAGETAQKRWSVLNAGSCNWTADYRLVRTDDSAVVAKAELALYPARAGEQAVWQVEIASPTEPGEYLASWQAQAPDGSLFGDPVFVLITVEE